MIASNDVLLHGNAHASRKGSSELRPMGPRYWTAYFEALATGPLVLQPHTARRRAGKTARSCPYLDIASAGVARVKAAIVQAQGPSR